MDLLIEQQRKIDHQSVLKEYYAQYLTVVRGLSSSSVKHYFDALNNISRRLKAKGIVERDIYEITDLQELEFARSVLYSDSDFIASNEKGKRMYSAGLNNYCRFAEGEGFHKIRKKMNLLDVPMVPETTTTTSQTSWKRSGILRVQAIEMAGYECEINPEHHTFIAEASNKQYMEGHHALPMHHQSHFNVSLDVYANIICLCPICHRRIHLGLKQDRIDMAKRIYELRMPRLKKCGIQLSEAEFVDVAATL